MILKMCINEAPGRAGSGDREPLSIRANRPARRREVRSNANGERRKPAMRMAVMRTAIPAFTSNGSNNLN